MSFRTRSLQVLGAVTLGSSLALAGALLPAQAEDNPDVQARSQLMKDMGKAMKTMGPMFKGSVDYDPAVVREAAATIESHSGIEITKLFPKGSLTDKSEALPTIWEDWDTFTKYADDLGFYAQGLVNSAGNPRGGDAAASGGTLGGQATLGASADQALTTDPAELAKMSPDVVFQAVGKTCGACHTDFRKKDE